MIVKLLNEHHLEFLSLKVGCKGSSESTFVNIPHCWKSHVAAHISLTPASMIHYLWSQSINFLIPDIIALFIFFRKQTRSMSSLL